MGLAYGEALLGDAQHAAACAQFATLRGKDLGCRDRGLPAAEACLRAGDPAKAVAWLGMIPPRFLPAQTAQDPRSAPLRSRDDFRALFGWQ